MALKENSAQTILDDPKAISIGLQRVFLDDVKGQWAMGLFTNDVKWRYQLAAYCPAQITPKFMGASRFR